jgi:hypothetical protein
MDELEARIAELRQQEELDSIRPELDGRQVMAILGLAPGPAVGRALDFLLELRLDEGPVGEEEAVRRLREWWDEQDGHGAGDSAGGRDDQEGRPATSARQRPGATSTKGKGSTDPVARSQ